MFLYFFVLVMTIRKIQGRKKQQGISITNSDEVAQTKNL